MFGGEGCAAGEGLQEARACGPEEHGVASSLTSPPPPASSTSGMHSTSRGASPASCRLALHAWPPRKLSALTTMACSAASVPAGPKPSCLEAKRGEKRRVWRRCLEEAPQAALKGQS